MADMLGLGHSRIPVYRGGDRNNITGGVPLPQQRDRMHSKRSEHSECFGQVAGLVASLFGERPKL